MHIKMHGYLDVRTHTFNFSMLEVSRSLWVQGKPCLHSKLQASCGCTASPSLKKQTNKRENKQKPPRGYNKSAVIKSCFFIFIISLPLFILSLLFNYKIASTTGAVSEVSTGSFYPLSYWISLLNSFSSPSTFPFLFPLSPRAVAAGKTMYSHQPSEWSVNWNLDSSFLLDTLTNESPTPSN